MSQVEFRKLEELTKDPANARTHSPEQIEQIANSIRRFGFTMPGLVDEVIRAGNGRYDACAQIYAEGGTIYLAPGKDRGGAEIPFGTMPVLDCSGWSEEERRAYALADNQLALNAGWDEDRLRAELEALTAAGFDIPVIGFDEAALAALFNPPNRGRTDPDDLPDVPDKPASVRGDVWVLGDHRLACGDATNAADVDSVLVGVAPNLMVTDPPYGVEYDASWRNDAAAKGLIGQKRSTRATGKVKNDDRADWREAWQLFPGDVAYVWHAGNKCHVVAESLLACAFDIRAQIIWNKNNIVIGRGDYHPKHEPLFYAVRKGRKGHWAGDRKQSTVWDIDKPMKSETGHSTQKPVECMRRPILNNSKPGDLVYEPFSGSGTTIIACEMEGRHCRAIELSEAYVDLAVARWEAFTGREAVHAVTGKTFAEVRAEREAEPAAA